MIDPAALTQLTEYLSEYGEENPLNPNDVILPGLIKYNGNTEFIETTEDSYIHTLIQLSAHKGRQYWLAYMTGRIDDYTIAGVVYHSSFGEHVDDEAEIETILWIGLGKVPEEVEKAMRES